MTVKQKNFWKSAVSFAQKYRNSLIGGANIFGVLIILLQYVVKFPFWLFSISATILPVYAYFFSNFAITDKEEKKETVKKYYGTWTVSAPMLINAIIMLMPEIEIFKKVLDIRLVICFIADIIVVAGVNYMTHRPVVKVKLQKLCNVNIPLKLHLISDASEHVPGDVVLCKSKETKQEVLVPRKDRFLHMLVLGPTGSGKTSQIILPMLNQDLQNHNAGITVIEPKGDLAEKAYAMAQHYGRKALYFNPVLKNCPTFNPLYGKEEDVIENVVTTFKMLDVDSAQYFQDMNEQLLRNALKVLKRTMGNDATLIDLSRLISNTGGIGRKMAAKLTQNPAPTEALMKENEDIVNYFLSDYFNEKSKSFESTSGVRSQVAKIVSNKFLRRVLNPQGRSEIDFDHHLEEGTVICISTAQGKLRDLGRFLGYFIILNFQSSTFKRPGNENTRRDHFLYIDEFQSYSNPGFADMLTQGRSYRVASHLATQNRALIGMGSGRDGDDFVELVSTNARNIVIFPGGNYNDAKYYSEQFGEIETVKIGESTSVTAASPIFTAKRQPAKDSFQVKEDTEARMSPTDIILRPFGEITYSIVQNNTLQPAGIGQISYIDSDLNKKLDQMVEENNIMMSMGINPNKFRDFSNQGILMLNLLNWDKLKQDYDAMKTAEKESVVNKEKGNETIISEAEEKYGKEPELKDHKTTVESPNDSIVFDDESAPLKSNHSPVSPLDEDVDDLI